MRINIDNALEDFRNRGYDLSGGECINIGKDSSIWKVTTSTNTYALKLYKENKQFASTRSPFQKYSRNRNFGKKIKSDNNSKVNPNNVRWEFNMVKDFYKEGAIVPEMIDYSGDAILMQYIGDRYRAPSLKDVKLEEGIAVKFLNDILNSIELFVSNAIVHADLTTENILVWNNKPFIIDFPQALDARTTPNFEAFLKRDLDYMVNYFSDILKLSPEDINSIYKRFYVLK